LVEAPLAEQQQGTGNVNRVVRSDEHTEDHHERERVDALAARDVQHHRPGDDHRQHRSTQQLITTLTSKTLERVNPSPEMIIPTCEFTSEKDGNG
jgi:hypothetical protein